jgi:hypothetical protein
VDRKSGFRTVHAATSIPGTFEKDREVPFFPHTASPTITEQRHFEQRQFEHGRSQGGPAIVMLPFRCPYFKHFGASAALNAMARHLDARAKPLNKYNFYRTAWLAVAPEA